MPGDFRCDRCEYSCAFYTTTSHTRLRVHWAPGIPHALFRGGNLINTSGAICVARSQRCAWCVHSMRRYSRFTRASRAALPRRIFPI